MYPYQETIFKKLANGDELQIISYGRGTGKSMLTAAYINGILQDPNYEVEVEERKLHGARHYTAHPTSGADWDAMVTWAVEMFGPSPGDGVWTPGARWYVNNARFWFRNQEDLTVFLLRWQK